ncbi:Neurotransmitter-gated ion-channel ligand-binding domain [Trinorchestia longiramus]|nr:Neurotransmitter-gated ion-channel ligand-binding domain [Trinorchestia longiramus]
MMIPYQIYLLLLLSIPSLQGAVTSSADVTTTSEDTSRHGTTSTFEIPLESDVTQPNALSEVTVLEFTRGASSAQYKGSISPDKELKSVTACGRFYMKSFSGRDPFMQLRYSKWNSNDKFRLELWSDKVRTVLANTWRFLWPPEHLKPNYWFHLCLTYEAAGPQSRYRLYLNGKEVASLSFELTKEVVANEFYAGYSQNENRSMDAFITQVNLWDYVLTPDDIMSIANCTSDRQGNYVSWTNGYETRNVESTQQTLKSLCQKTIGVTYMWFPKVSDKEAFYLCDALGTHLPLPGTTEECYKIHNVSWEAWSSDKFFFAFITPLTDEGNEGVFYRNYDRQTVLHDTILWGSDEPNGDIYENCVMVSQYGYFDADCTGYQCATCKFEEPKELTFRGTCERELRNVFFLAQQTEGVGSLRFKGFDMYRIEKIDNTWTWSNAGTPIATMDQADINYPMGRRTWTLTGKVPVCGQQNGKRLISLSVCTNSEFTCDNALCIPHDARCDLKYDCLDQSDEHECNLVFFPSLRRLQQLELISAEQRRLGGQLPTIYRGYRSDLPPTPSNGEPAEVSLSLSISAMGVDTSKTQLYATYLLQLMWQDNRLTYRNLKTSISLNLIPSEIMSKIWIPVVGFVNTERNEHTTLDDESSMNIIRKTPMQEWNSSSSTEEALYSGLGNDLHLSRKYTTLFVCDFDLNLYPFDVQRCPIELRLLTALSDQLQFKREAVTATYTGPDYLIEYQVGELKLEFGNGSESEGDSGVVIQVTLGRRSGYAMLTIYIPSLILLIICYVTLFFRPEIFEASSSLPKTSYFKMVDIWLLFCIGVIFLIIIFHALVDASLSYPDSKDKWVATSSRLVNRTAEKWLHKRPERQKNYWRIFWDNYILSSSTAPTETDAVTESRKMNINRQRTKIRRRRNDGGINEKVDGKVSVKTVFLEDNDRKQQMNFQNLDGDSIDIDVVDLVEARLKDGKNFNGHESEQKISSQANFQKIDFSACAEAGLIKKNTKSGTGKKGKQGTTNTRSDRLILSSKIIILVLVGVFNLVYWGYILG